MKKLLFIIICIILLGFIYEQYRYFYQIGNITFTIWKRWGGTCYITPYRYLWITLPEKDCIKTSNDATFSIFVSSDSLFIFSYITPEDEFECNLLNYKCRVFSVAKRRSLADVEAWDQKIQYYEDSLKLPCAYINIKEMYIDK